jgi:ubiquitin C-terminal hydrolase
LSQRRDNYVGFLNPRHISCYANSLVQQFYMIPEFRNSLFEITSTQSPRESALSEIQRLFGFLQLSERHHIDPTQLIQHFAKKMNINQQNDASEFFSHVTERLEEELAKTNRKSLLDELFKTTLNREIICGVNKEHVSTGVEENLLLGVEMFKTTNLNQALASLFEVLPPLVE